LLRSLDGTANMVQLGGRLRELGQIPLYPPNVKGWDGGRAWINSSTLLGRTNLMRAIVESPESRFAGGSLDQSLARHNLASNAATVDFLAELLVAVPLDADVRQQLAQSLDQPGVSRPQAVKQTIHLLGSLPEFQLA
jgi:hypothetical protein